MKTTLLIISMCAFLMSCNGNNNGTYRSNTATNYNDSQGNNQDPDWQITSRVKTAIMEDNSLSTSGRTVSVETNNGVVTLTGSVPSREESAAIERKARSITGVRRVDNRLTINP